MLKLLKKKSGFTLAECIIAIAIFAIMALMVLMLMSATIKTHDQNAQTSRKLLAQKEELANGDSNVKATGTITVDFGGGAVGTFTVQRIVSDEADIPGNKNVLEITDFRTPTP